MPANDHNDVEPIRRRTFSLAQLLGGATLMSLWFAVMYYSIGLGVAVAVSSVLLILRIRWHRYTAWKQGWRVTPMLLVTTTIFSLMAAALVYSVVAHGLGVGMFRIVRARWMYNQIYPIRDEIVWGASWAFSLIAFETVVALSLRRINQTN